MITVKDFTSKVSQYSSIKEQEYINVVESLNRYNNLTDANLNDKYQALSDIVKNVDIFLRTYPNSRKNFDLKELKKEAFLEVLSLYETYRNNIIKKEAYTVATSTIFSEELESYFNFWKSLNPEYNFKIYYDSEAQASSIVYDFFKQSANEQVIKNLKEKYEDLYDFQGATFSNESLKLIYNMKRELKDFFKSKRDIDNTAKPVDILKEFLTTKYNYNEDTFNQAMQSYQNYFENLGAIDIRKDLTSSFNAEIDYQLYERELFIKLNSFDASNILKLNILDKIGGVYVDINYLPSIKKDIFSGIQLPENVMKLPKSVIQQLKLIIIMKSKNYVKGFDKENIYGIDKYNEELSDEVKITLSNYLNQLKTADEIFEKIGDLSSSELAFLTDIKSNYEKSVIAAHPGSIATKAIIEQIRIRYSTLNEIYDKIEGENNSYDTVRLALINEIKITTDAELKTFLLNTRYYIENGLIDIDYGYNPSKHLNGYEVLRGGIKNILEFKEFNTLSVKEIYNKRLYLLFSLPKIEVTYYSQEALRREEEVYFGNNNQYHKTAEKLGIEIKDHLTSKTEPINLDSLTKLVNDTERFIYGKDYVNVIFQIQDDNIIFSIAKDIFVKYAENSILIQMETSSDEVYLLNKETKEVVKENISLETLKNLTSFKKMKITLVGHGNVNSINGKSPEQLMDYMKNSFEKLNAIFTGIEQLEISFFACKNFNLEVNLEDTYPVRFLNIIKNTDNAIKSLVKSNIERISISTSAYSIARISGRLNISAYALFLDREDAVLRGLIPRYLIKYNENGEITVKAKEVKESIELRNLIEASSKQNLSNLTLGELEGVLLDYEDISITSIEEQDRGFFNTEIEDDLLKIQDFLSLSEELHEDILEIIKENNLTENYFPDLESVQEVEDGFSLTMIDKTTGEKKTVLTEKESFIEYKNTSKDVIDTLKDGLENVHQVSTLNAAFFLQSLLDYTKSKDEMNNLNIAVQIQIYTQLSSNSLGLITDVNNIVKIVNNVLENPIHLIPELIERLQFLGFILDSINLGSSIYELINTNDNFEKEVIAGNVGITSVNLALGLASTISYVTGASLTAEVLGILAVPIAGITIGLPSLIENILKIKYSAAEVMKFFEQLNTVKENGYYTLSDDQNALIPTPLVPAKQIDLTSNTVDIGDMYISKMTGGSIVSSEDAAYPKYFSAPYPDNTGEPIKFSNIVFEGIKQNDLNKDIIVLPSALNVRYSIDNNFLLGSSSWSGVGEDVLDSIRKYYGGRVFHWRFYAVGGEKILTELDPNYQETKVDIICDNNNRTFISPLISDENIANYLSYSIKYGDNADYTYVFQTTPIKLEIEPVNKDSVNSSNWFFRIDNLIYEDPKDLLHSKLKDINTIFNITYNNDNSIELKIGNQSIIIPKITNEKFYLNFQYDDYKYKYKEKPGSTEGSLSDSWSQANLIFRLDINNSKIDKLILSYAKVELVFLLKMKLLDYLKDFNLAEELLENIVISFNANLPLDNSHPKVNGMLNLIKDEYILFFENMGANGNTYTSAIHDKNFSEEPDVIFNLSGKDSKIFKKYNKELNINEYFLEGFSEPIIDEKNVSSDENDKNEYLLQINDTKNLTIKNIQLGKLVFAEFVSALAGMESSHNIFNKNNKFDITNAEERKKIILGVYDYIENYVVKGAISLSNYPATVDLSQKFDDNLLVYGEDNLGRNLSFNLSSNDYSLAPGEWEIKLEDNEEINYFSYNLLGKKELILSKKENINKSDYILLDNSHLDFLESYIDTLIISCAFETDKIFFKNTKNNIYSINILLPTSSNANPLVIYLPFKEEDLKWDVNGSNLIIYVSNSSRKITILDVFNEKNTKEIIISVDGTEPIYNESDKTFSVDNSKNIDLISFMKNITQYLGD